MSLLGHIGLVRPWRFERTLAALVVFALGLVVAVFGWHLRRTGQLDMHSMRGAYFIYVAILLVLGFAFARWPRCSMAVLSLAALEIGFGIGSALFVEPLPGTSPLFPDNVRIDPLEPRFAWHPLLQIVPTMTPADDVSRTKFLHNSAGLRGKERSEASLSGKIIVALFGASTTYDVVPDGKTWGERLEALLGEDRYAVVNHGVPGYATAELTVQTAFYEKAFGVEPRCSLYYVGGIDLRNNHVRNLDPAFADFHLRSQIDAQAARRLAVPVFSISPALHYGSRLAALAFDTVRPVPSPQGDLRADLDPVLVDIYVRNVRAISAINRQRGIRTLWTGQLVNRSALTSALPSDWLPLVADKDVWPLMEALNGILQRTAAELGDVYIDVPIADFDGGDFADEVHFRPSGSSKFAAHLAPAVASACR